MNQFIQSLENALRSGEIEKIEWDGRCTKKAPGDYSDWGPTGPTGCPPTKAQIETAPAPRDNVINPKIMRFEIKSRQYDNREDLENHLNNLAKLIPSEGTPQTKIWIRECGRVLMDEYT
ncbi:unnamed protein product, partial [marine sediment metagenome]